MREEIERYLHGLWQDHASGEAVAETSGYGALQNLLNAAGRELRPLVRAFIAIRNRSAGIPDGRLFTADQLRSREGDGAGGRLPTQLPAHGAVEV